MRASVIIRTYNESKHLPALLDSIERQRHPGLDREIVVVDSGSSDHTVRIAREKGCRIVTIDKAEFSFGRSLNIGCASARGDVLVFVSGHCIPADEHWIARLVAPVLEGSVVYSYGRQIGNESSKFSECRIFEKYFGPTSRIPQDGFYCNNANAALLAEAWRAHPFDEELTGLEDMHLGKRLQEAGKDVGYVADAVVYHIHDEGWAAIKNRFEREALALQHIMPEVHVSGLDFLRYLLSSVLLDVGTALSRKLFLEKFHEICLFRTAQYWGVYRGNHLHRKVSRMRKERYFFPR